jgi:hemoglobin
VSWTPSPEDTPFDRVGGEARVRALAAAFYDTMDEREPALARLHELDAHGRVAEGPRERFTLFLIEWLGGPQTYSPVHGHPRLRMRHARFPVDEAMRDAWVRCMKHAMEATEVQPEVRAYLERRFFEVADFMRNQ